MNRYLLCLLLIIGLSGCQSLTGFRVPNSVKPADAFARQFIDNIITGKIDSSYAKVDPEVLTNEAEQYILNANRSIQNNPVLHYRVVGITYSSNILSAEKITIYQLAYEYEFEKGNILFATTVREEDNNFFIISFNGKFLTAPLAQLTKFTLTNKSTKQYIFFLFVLLTPLFIILSLIFLIISQMSLQQKIIWFLIILFISLPRFTINWNSGQIDFNLINISLLRAGFFRPNLYTAWILSFNIPIGAILFWIKRKRLSDEASNMDYYALEEGVENPDTAESENNPTQAP